MADKYLNNTGLAYYHNRIKNEFASQDDLDALSGRVDDIVSEGGEPNVIDSISLNGTAITPVNKNVNIDLSDYATEDYVDQNGGKIDKIKVNNVEQTIDTTDKSVNITVPTTASQLEYDGRAQLGDTVADALDELDHDLTGKQNVLDTQTAYTNKGTATKVAQITTNTLGQVTNITEVDIDIPSTQVGYNNQIGDQNPQNVGEAINALYTYSQSIETKVSTAYVYKGSVASVSNLPSSDNNTGDVYDVQDTGMNYAWNGTQWDALGQLIDTSVLWTSTSGQSNSLIAMTTAEIDEILNPTV